MGIESIVVVHFVPFLEVMEVYSGYLHYYSVSMHLQQMKQILSILQKSLLVVVAAVVKVEVRNQVDCRNLELTGDIDLEDAVVQLDGAVCPLAHLDTAAVLEVDMGNLHVVVVEGS